MSSRINENCTLCDKCREACPAKAISKGSRTYVIDTDFCTNCLLCASVCPADAIENPALPKKLKKARKERKLAGT